MALDLDALDAGLLPDRRYTNIVDGEGMVADRKPPRNPNPGMVKRATPGVTNVTYDDDRRMLDARPKAGGLARVLIKQLRELDADAADAATVWMDRNEETLTVGQCSEWINRLRDKIATYAGAPIERVNAALAVTAPAAAPAPAYDPYDDIPDGNYALELNRDKTHFYRVSRKTRGDRTYVNVQERASDELFRIYNWGQRKAVLDDIRTVGAEASRMMFSERLGRCWNCYKSLTDEDNPYKVHGLGPDCGPKMMG